MIRVTDIPDADIDLIAIRASGPGGQHVNKVSSAIQLRFDVRNASLPYSVKQKLLSLRDSRVSGDGVIVIKAQEFRHQERNRQAALDRLDELLLAAQRVRKVRKSTRPTKASVKRRLDNKRKQGQAKKMRRPVDNRDY